MLEKVLLLTLDAQGPLDLIANYKSTIGVPILENSHAVWNSMATLNSYLYAKSRDLSERK